MIMVSACLAGINCKYNGNHNYNAQICEFLKGHPYFLVCPEVMSGLAIPRLPCEMVGGTGLEVLEGKARVLNTRGVDETLRFIDGAKTCLALARLNQVTRAILKNRSPSCGCGQVYDGTFSSCVIPGDGVTTAALKFNGIEVLSEDDF